MNVQATKAVRVPTAAVTSLIVDALLKAGVPKDDAIKIAGLMLQISRSTAPHRRPRWSTATTAWAIWW